MPDPSTILIRNARIWASPESGVVEGGVRVESGRIAAVGAADGPADRVIDAGGALLMPGLVQGHIHLCQVLFRGLAEDLPLLPWLRRYIWPLEAAHDEASLRASAQLGIAELIRGGTTAFLSMESVRHTAAVVEAAAETGIMGIVCHCLMDDSAGYPPLAVDPTDAFRELDALRAERAGYDRLRIGVAPRFALSCTAETLRRAADYAREHGLMLHTHSSEQEEEVALVQERTGLRNIEFLHSVGLSGPDVGLAHCVHTDPRERERLVETGTRVLHCPSANLKLGSGVAPIPEYLEMGLAVSLGGDGAPCNNRLDAFTEMREAALIQKPRLGPAALSAVDTVRIATSLGAKALNWDHEMGTLEPGKRANLILVDRDPVHVLPGADPATDLVYAHQSGDVTLTMVDGRILYENGRLTTIDEERLRAVVREQRDAVAARAGIG